jgi:hypothetical protein
VESTIHLSPRREMPKPSGSRATWHYRLQGIEETVSLGFFDRFRGGRRGGSDVGIDADRRYLRDWARARAGVEAFVEPKTSVTDVTVVLIAGDGEWTRRRAGGESGARWLGQQLHIPVYDVQRVGYPQRMRDYDARRRAERRRAAEEG